MVSKGSQIVAGRHLGLAGPKSVKGLTLALQLKRPAENLKLWDSLEA